jgi:stage II sporulation protein M
MKKNKRVKKKRESLDIKKEYLKCLDYLKDSKKFIFSVIILFAVFLLIGLFVPAPQYLQDILKDLLSDLFKKTQNLSLPRLIWYIFSNNVQVSLFGMLLGMIFFGIIPLFITVMNGYILGYVFSISVQQAGILSLWKIFPHGIFELPAVFISLGMGLKLGILMLGKKEKFKESFWDSARVFLLVVIPLLIIAGIIEGLLIYLTK